jgi:hypothetical protein
MNGQDPENLKWKHIYIELSENVGKHVNTTSIELYFVAFLEKGKSSANIYVDNIKVVHFP